MEREGTVSDESGRRRPSHPQEATKRVVSVESPGWEVLQDRLALVLGRMAVDTFLVISASSPDAEFPYYVQFAQGGRSGFLAEAVGNAHLGGTSALSPTQDEQMGDLGWMSPTPRSTTDVNYSRQWPMPVPFADAAALAVRTLREVYGIRETSQLAYKSFARGGHQFAQPTLGIDAEPPSAPSGDGHRGMPTTGEVRALVEASVKSFLHLAEVKVDDEGDIPIRMGSAMVFIRVVDGQPPLVQVFAPVIWGIPPSPEVLEAVNDINLRIRFGRVMWTGREVIAGMELSAARISADDIGFACLQVGSIADHFDDELRLRFAGATLFGTTPGRPN
jgi:Putative bacterial sensory transduction regulator